MDSIKRLVMRRCILISIVMLLLTLCFSLVCAVGGYVESVREDIFLIRPDTENIDADQLPPSYLSDEDLMFYTCVEYDDVEVRTSVLCRDDNAFKDLRNIRWGPDNCYLTSVDLADFEGCTKMTIQSDYIKDDENIKIKKDININKHTQSLSRIVTTQYSDGGWDDSLDTAHAILALAQYPEVFDEEIMKAQEYLKLQRNEEEKCWPKNDCKLSTTAYIVALLSQANLDDTLRIMHDGRAYLKSKLFKIENTDTWTMRVLDHPSNLDDGVPTECLYDHNGVRIVFNISENNYTLFTLNPDYEDFINVVCTENVDVRFYDTDYTQFLFYEGDNMTYDVPGACLTINNENVNCDYRATALYLLTEIEENDDRKKIDNYLSDHVVSYVLGGKYLYAENSMNAALYAASAEDKDDAQDLITYTQLLQKNEGFWQDDEYYYNNSWYEFDNEELTYLPHVVHDNITNVIIKTSYNVLGLLGAGLERTDEPITDAMRWISLHENEYAYNISEDDLTDEEIAQDYWQNVSEIVNDTKRNAMTFYALNRYARPMIKSEPRIIIITNNSVDVRLVNPTVFTYKDLTYSFTAPLNNYVEVEEKEYLGPYGFRVVTVSQKTLEAPDVFGYLGIKNSGDEIAKIPVLITSYPELLVENQKAITVFGTRSSMTLNIDKSPHVFSCSLEWGQPDIKSEKAFTITESGPLEIALTFTKAETVEKVYEGVLRCKTGSTTIENTFSILANKFSSRPITITPTSLYINMSGEDASFTVSNLLDQTIDVFISTEKPDPYFELSKTMLTLYPGESENVTIINSVTSGLNYTAINSFNVKTFNLEEPVSLVVEITATPPSTRPIFLMIMFFVIILSLIGGVGYYGYHNRQKIVDWYNKHFHKESERAKITKEILIYERKERSRAILNMMEILRLRKMGESDIRKELRNNGFTDDDINDALKMQTEEEARQIVKKPEPKK